MNEKKKMKGLPKRILSFVLMLVMVVGLMPNMTLTVMATDGNSGIYNDLTWSYSEETKTLTISGSGDMESQSSATAYPWRSVATNMENLVVEPGVTSIGSVAFNQALELKTVTLSNTVIKIGQWAFRGCNSLSKVYVNASNCALTTGDDINANAVIYVPDASVSTYKTNWSARESRIFAASGELQWTLEDGTLNVTSGIIPNYTGSNNTPWAANRESVTSVVIGADVKSIGDYAFGGMPNLTSVTFSNTANITIGVAAFINDANLTSIVIPSTVTEIKSSAFAGTGLGAVTMQTDTPAALSNNNASFPTFPASAVITVPAGKGEAYSTAEGWSTLGC